MELELEAKAQDRMLTSYGVLAAIAEAFGAKKTIQRFAAKLNPGAGGAGRAGDNSGIAKLRSMIGAAGQFLNVKEEKK